MAKYFIKGETLTNIADAIRSKTGETAGITVNEMAESINSIVLYSGIDTSDATAAAEDIMNGEIAYVDGEKITGTFTIENEVSVQDNLISQIQTALEGKAGSGAGLDTSDATAIADDILSGKTAYVDGIKITGTHECAEGSGGNIETITGTIDFYDPYNPYVFCYEDGTGAINKFTTSVSASSGTFTIRKNSIIVFHCPKLGNGLVIQRQLMRMVNRWLCIMERMVYLQNLRKQKMVIQDQVFIL